MKEFSRTLKYSLIQGTRYFLVALLATFVYGLYFLFLSSNELNITNYLGELEFYFFFVQAAFILIYSMINASFIVPVQIGFGSRRVYAALSISIINLVVIVEAMSTIILYRLLCVGIKSRLDLSLGMVFLIFVAVSGAGALFSVLVMKFGKIAYIVSVFVSIFGIAFVIGFFGDEKIITEVMTGGVVAILSFVLFAIGNLLLIWYSKHIEIKA